MKKILMILVALTPLTLWAQDNTWEQPEEEEQQEVKAVKVNPDAKYLRGAVTMEDGKVVFKTTIEAPGKPAADIYRTLLKYMDKMTRERNQLNSMLVVTDSTKWEIGGTYEEWLVFHSNAIALDRTHLYFVLDVKCYDGRAEVVMERIRYLYGEGRDAKRMKAEEWINDDNAVNKKNTRLLPITGKFRRKTIDRKDFLFNKFETLLK